MTWTQFILAIPSAVSEAAKLGREAVSLLRDGAKALQQIAEDNKNRQLEDVARKQTELELKIERATTDAQRVELAKLREQLRRGA